VNESRKGVPIDLLVFTLAATLASVGVFWLLRKPDAVRTLNMRACLVTKRTAQSLADSFQLVADNAASQYQALRNTTV
jgi:hypothetical protein